MVATEYVGDGYYGQCEVDGWTDIVAIYACPYQTVGIRRDGTAVATVFLNYYATNNGQREVSDWTDVKLPQGVQ